MYIRCSETSLHHLSLKSLITIVEVNFKMSELCISCDKEVNGRRHAVTCDVCDRWQHRLCGTGIFIFIYLFIYLFILLILCLTGCSIAFVGQVSFIYLFCTNLFIYLFIYLFSLV